MRSSGLARGLAVVLAGALVLAACTGDDYVLPTDSATIPAPDREAREHAADGVHVNNPFAGATMYVNSMWSDQVQGTANATSDSDLADAMIQVSSQPTGVWMDRISAIEGNADGPGLRFHLDDALAQRDGDTPITVTVVVYDLPGRDCFALASNGELPATDEGLERYQSEYIDVLASIFAEPQYEGLRIVTVIEPDSLPNLVTNASAPNCQAADPYYRAGVAYALDAFAAIPNVYAYLDAAHSGWLGWDTNSGPSVQLFADVVRSTEAGFDSVDGFVTNTANYTPTEEVYLPNASLQVGGPEIRSGSFYEWNRDFDEADWTADLYSRAVGAGFPDTIGMIIDTSRNGWGGDARPTAVVDASSADAYVSSNKLDQRTHRGAWCNQSGAGLGLRPQALPSGYPDSHLDAYLWVKPPGESDGSASEIPNDEGKSFDPMCDPSYVSDRLAGQATGALADAPLSGKWFASQFTELVANAYPAVGEENPPAREDASAMLPVGEVAAGSGGDGSGGSADAGSGGASGGGGAGGSGSGGSGGADGGVGSGQVLAEFEGEQCSVVAVSPNQWDGGFQADVTVTAKQPMNGWTVTLVLPAGSSTDGLWNGDASGTSGTVTVRDAGWNGALAVGATGAFGFTASGSPSGLAVTGCARG
ncbi:glycoside hydrolase family 6 protein [Demequina zhanjiangensis]|uniref:Glucanase n=1 Tax=Demequina zhanjiangensis TaxID=3051659 RepID=A0ABT8G2U2_9MICO|nr:glycoside hydrolase family 6 protein [Demequina sp. SYSU T00b26]MDN4473458.1 glycoside hydrolase family 6 protein [Demequina sp. SYSU T00b26]